MDTATLDLYFQKFDEIIYDEGKIATWNLLANTLKLPINEIPELFSNYLSDRRQLKPKDFAITYCLCGILKDQEKLEICCVDEDNLHKKRELFSRVIKQQVYSVQKSKNIDFNAISLVDQIGTNQGGSLLGSIVGNNCIKRSIRKKILPSAQTKPNNPLFNKVAKSEETQDQINSSSTSSSSQNKTQTNSKIKNNGGIANFFTKAPVKANLPKIETDDSKSNIENNSDCKENDIPIVEDNSTKNNTQYNDKITNFKEEQMEIEETTKKTKNEHTNKKRKKTQKDEAPHKKRKRIQVINDSDSSDIFSDAEDVVEKTDDEPEPLPPPKPQLVSKNKVRKAVDKTYVDEEGFIITKTEYVFESASEDEKEAAPVKEEPKPKILEKKNSTTDSENDKKTVKGKKNKKLVSGKQQTLMNFFKKL